jgi:hypothetical protein
MTLCENINSGIDKEVQVKFSVGSKKEETVGVTVKSRSFSRYYCQTLLFLLLISYMILYKIFIIAVFHG